MVLRSFFLLIVCLLLCQAVAFAGITERVSVSSTGEEGNEDTPPSWIYWEGGRKVSADGRYVVFASDASNLMPGDDNDCSDVFLRDRAMGLTYCLSVTPTGAVSDMGGWHPAISADGRYVAFESSSTKLVAGDTNGCDDIFVRDIELGVTELVSVSTSGEQGSGSSSYPSISADGRYVVFLSGSENLTPEDTEGILLRDRQLGTTELITFTAWGYPAYYSGVAGLAHVSADGRFVCFTWEEDWFTPSDSNGWADVFVRDRLLATTYRVSTGSYGEQGNGESRQGIVSDDGRFVAFVSKADNLVPGDTNGYTDVFIKNLESWETVRASVDPSGNQVYADSYSPSLSDDGRFIAFASGASELVPGHTPTRRSVFVRDMETGAVEVASADTTGEPVSECVCTWSSLSADGRYVVFISGASDVVPGDTNECRDVFIRDRQTFGDVSVGHWAYCAIDACYSSGLVAGYPDGSYHPEILVTRDQMAVYISRGVAGGDDSVPAGPAEATFPDVPSTHWAYDHIEYAADINIVEGYGDGSYQPNLDVTRGQMAVFIARAIANPTGEEGLTDYQPPALPSYPDVSADYWCYSHVECLAEEGVVQGYTDGLYRPTTAVTRDQMAVYIARAFGLM